VKLIILTPAGLGITPLARLSREALILTTATAFAHAGHDLMLGQTHRAPITEARNTLVGYAKEREADYLYWMDDDAHVPPTMIVDLLERLIATGADAVAPFCPWRLPPHTSMALRGTEVVHDEGWITSTGFHCVLMTMALIRRQTHRPLFHKEVMPDGSHETEDRYFWRHVTGCKLWHAADLVAEHGDETIIGKQGPS